MSNKLVEIFKNELDQIISPDFKEFVINKLEQAPDFILDMPSSTTGKYHPADEIGPTGMVKHIKRCVVIADEIARLEQHSDDEKDILIAGCILHDLFKTGKVKEKYTVAEHPIYSFQFIMEGVSHKYQKLLAYICLAHEGQWTIQEAYRFVPDEFKQSRKARKLAKSMHLIDYISSRRSIWNCMQEIKNES